MSAVVVLILIILVLVVVQIGFMVYLFRGRNDGAGKDAFVLIQQQMQELARTMDDRVRSVGRELQDTTHRQHSDAQRLIKDITAEITSVKELGRQTATFAEQLKSLQDVLKNPKQRGVLGEYYLETVLKNVLPPGMYQMQYAFSNGEVVDAAVFIKDKVIPIDSKFSLENYNRLVQANPDDRVQLERAFVNDLKLRIQETSKYIRPEEKTMDFAFMFIPSEGIYYDLLVNSIGSVEGENLIHQAASKYKVIIVSPTSFLAYLQTVLQGLNALQIEQRAADIQKRVGELGKHIQKYEEYQKKLGAALGTTVSHFNNSYKELKKIDKDVYRISEYSADITPESLDKPQLDD